MKRICSLLLALVLLSSMMPTRATAASLDNGLVYEVYEDHVAITDYSGDATELVIPAEIDGLPVTVIDRYAFDYCSNLTSISIPDCVTQIGTSAFALCTSLSSISIPNGVTKISEYAFFKCTSLTSVSLPDGITSIGIDAFSGCASLANISIPDSVAKIGDTAFSGCSSLTSISIPDGVTSISSYTFSGCTSLTNISIPDSVTQINNYAFRDCTSLSSIDLLDGLVKIYGRAFIGCSSLNSISIPGSVNELGDSVFGKCTSLQSIYFVGDPPYMLGAFTGITATAYYPAENPKWAPHVMWNAGGSVMWVPYDPNHTHNYIAIVTAPTCTEQGYTTYTCDCGDSYVDNYSDALGHSHEATVTVPSCTEQGYTTYTCSCGDSYVTDYVDTLGHEYEDGICIRCSEADPDYEDSVENPFTDVPDGAWYEAPIAWAVENDITNGLSATEFGPTAICNRAQVVTFLWRAVGCPEPTSTVNPFVDVAAGSFYEYPVLWAAEKGITTGADATHFNPNGVCNRAQVVTFLHRAFGSPAVSTEGLPFTDVPAGSWYEAPIAWAVENEITNGLSATEFGPNAPCNRAQVVTFLYRAHN